MSRACNRSRIFLGFIHAFHALIEHSKAAAQKRNKLISMNRIDRRWIFIKAGLPLLVVLQSPNKIHDHIDVAGRRTEQNGLQQRLLTVTPP